MRPITRVLERYRRAWHLDPDEEMRHLHVAQCPRGFDFPRENLPRRFLYGSPWRRQMIDLPMALDDRPLVFCSLGTLQGSRRRLFGKMAAACAAVGARAVIAHGGGLSRAEEVALPGDPLVRAFWPQEAVLRRCAAAILHGGFNSVLDAPCGRRADRRAADRLRAAGDRCAAGPDRCGARPLAAPAGRACAGRRAGGRHGAAGIPCCRRGDGAGDGGRRRGGGCRGRDQRGGVCPILTCGSRHHGVCGLR